MRPNDASTKISNGTTQPVPPPTPAVGKAQASLPPEPALTTDDWVAGMIQTMNGLGKSPELLKQLRKRSF